MMKGIGGFAFAVLATVTAAAAEFYVSPDGDDRNDGSAAKPVKTLQRALDLTRAIEREEDKEIVMRDGFYPFEKPVVFRAGDYDITVRAEHRRKAVLSGSVKLAGWRTDDLDKRFLVAELPFDPVEDVSYMMTCGGEDRPVAAYPEKGRMKFKGGDGRDMIAYDEGTFPAGTDLGGLDLASVWLEIPQEWSTTITPIKSIDTTGRTIELKKKADYSFAKFNQGFRIHNCRLGMTQPGSWMYEATAKKVIYWPRQGETAENLDCRITRAGVILAAAHSPGVTFRGLVLEGCMKTLRVENPYHEAPILGAIFIGSHSRNVVIDDCEVRHCAGVGIYATKPENCVVKNSHVHDIGGCGINFFDGGDRSDVLNCEVNDFGKGAAAVHGIRMELSNVKCIGNHVHHGSGNGVVMWGCNSVFASNELHHVMQKARDGGGLYGGFRDCVLKDNYVHDIGWPGLYVDEGSLRVLYTGNRFENCGWPIHAHSAQYVTVSNNVFRNDGGFRFSFQGSGHCVFSDNKIYTVEPVKYEPYLSSCDFWGRNELYVRQPDGSYRLKETITLERQRQKPGALTCPFVDADVCRVFNKKGEADSTAFKRMEAPSIEIAVGADGYPNQGTPCASVRTLYDEYYAYFWFLRLYNACASFPGMANFTSTGWGHSDCNRIDFEGGRSVVISPDGSIETRGGLVVTKKDVRISDGGRVCVIRIPLASIGVRGAKKMLDRLDLENPEDEEFDSMLVDDAKTDTVEVDKNAPATDVTGLKVGFNASIWVEDQREQKSAFAVEGENFATGTLEFVKKEEAK